MKLIIGIFFCATILVGAIAMAILMWQTGNIGKEDIDKAAVQKKQS